MSLQDLLILAVRAGDKEKQCFFTDVCQNLFIMLAFLAGELIAILSIVPLSLLFSSPLHSLVRVSLACKLLHGHPGIVS